MKHICFEELTGNLRNIQKRAELRARLDLDRYMTSESEGEEITQQDGKRDVRAFASDGISTTVTIAPFSLNSDRYCYCYDTRTLVAFISETLCLSLNPYLSNGLLFG